MQEAVRSVQDRQEAQGFVDFEDQASVERLGNRCAHHGCRKRMTLADDKPDAGWAVVTVRRHGKTADRMTTFIVCPEHAVTATVRQMRLFSDPDRDPKAFRDW